MTVQTDGYTPPELPDPNTIPQIPDRTTAGSSSGFNNNPSFSGFKRNVYSKRYSPHFTDSPKFWGKNGFYMNGPHIDPFNHAATVQSQIDGYVRSVGSAEQRRVVNDFSMLVDKYGNTNSPGILWSLAKLGLPDTEEITKSVLSADARVLKDEYVSSMPSRASSPMATTLETGTANPKLPVEATDAGEGFMQNIWQPVEFLARNAFALLSMPNEARIGATRGIGGELSKASTEGAGDAIAGAVAELGSLVFPPIALWADRVRGDNEFINPWEQTEFGQTLLTMSAGAGFDAFTTAQAGLDVQRAQKELEQDPEYMASVDMQTEQGVQKFQQDAQALAQQKNYYAEPGWFIDETSKVGESQRRATFDAWAIPGPDDQMTAWTLGRGISSWVGGPDWNGYGVMSGIIDAIDSIALDPTIIGGKFGIPSKILKGAGMALEKGGVAGAEAALTIGKQAAKEQRAISNAATQLAKAGEIVGVDPVELAKMDLAAQADVVRQAKKQIKAAEHAKKVNVDNGLISQEARSAVRAAADDMRISGLLDTATPTNNPRYARMAQLWQDFIDNSYVKTEGKLYEYDFSPFAFSEWSNTIRNNPEDAALWSEVSRRHAEAALNGDVPYERDGAIQFLDQINMANRTVARPKDVPAQQVLRDTANVWVDDTIDADSDIFRKFGYSGTIIKDVPETGKPVFAVVNPDGLNPVESVAYLKARGSVNLVNATDAIDPAVSKKLKPLLNDFVDRLEVRRNFNTAPDGEVLSIPDQVINQVYGAVDFAPRLEGLLANPNTTYGELLKFAADHGFDNILGQFLREAKVGKKGIDGISGVDIATGKGIWIGDNPRFLTYQANEEMRTLGLNLRMTEDYSEQIAQADISGMNVAANDFRAQSVQNMMDSRVANRSQREYSNMSIDGYMQDKLFSAMTAQAALDADLQMVDNIFADPAQALRQTIGYEAGMMNTKTGGLSLDEGQVRKFLFGNGPASYLANRVLDSIANFVSPEEAAKALADPDEYARVSKNYIGNLALVTNGKWSPEVYQQLADNAINGGGKDGVLGVLAPHVGIDVSRGSISKTTQILDTDGKRVFRTWRTAHPHVARALGQMPTARKVNLNNSDEVTENIILYGRYGNVDDEKLANIIGDVIYNAGKGGAVPTNRNAILKTFNLIGDNLVEKLNDTKYAKVVFSGPGGEKRKNAIIQAMQNSTRLYLGGKTKTSSVDVERFATESYVNDIVTESGEKMRLPSVVLDTEIAQGFIGLPSVDEWSAALSRFVMTVSRTKPTESMYKFAKRFFDNFFRTSLLVFRGAYIIRNVAEMQVRMFLNGHKSFISDPASMIGLVFGGQINAKRLAKYNKQRGDFINDYRNQFGVKPTEQQIQAAIPEPNKFGERFAPYNQTVLDTNFEVGLDEDLAIANHVEDYWALIRKAHSLTDPRIYNNAVRTGWEPISWGTPGFFDGWAHELIMLERSDLAKLVLGGTPHNWTAVANSAGTKSAEDIAVEWLLGNDVKAKNIRELMVAADDKFDALFASPAATKQYLFTNPNSIRKRISQFTADDPRLLDYIKNGVVKAPSGTLRLRSIPNNEKRIEEFSTLLRRDFNNDDFARHFVNGKVGVPWTEKIDRKNGFSLVNMFFDVANKIERIGAVGPEYRLAYWDRIAELAPMLNAGEVDRALKAARTTLGPLKRMNPDGKLDSIGSNHPAFKALDDAKKSGQDGMLTLDDIHAMASKYAADEVTGLFYDAAQRNRGWYALRLLFPFGQAWGNTLATWAKLGTKKPIQIYKAQKAFNALIEDDSTAVYEFAQDLGMYGQYAPGFAPWDQDANGGFFYTNQFGDTTFAMPLVGRGMASAVNWYGKLTGQYQSDIGDIPITSPVQSLNFALGADSITPGVSGFAAIPLVSGMVPDDNAIVGTLRQLALPFGTRDVTAQVIPAWLSKTIAGVGAVPGMGDALEGWLDVLSPANKNKNVRDAVMILASSGDYQGYDTNPQVMRSLQEDASALSKALLVTTGLFQNVSPSTPYPEFASRLTKTQTTGEQIGSTDMKNTSLGLYTVGMLNSLFQQYRARNGFDESAAKEEFVKDFGPVGLFAAIGDWKNVSRVPKSQALKVAQEHPDFAKAYLDEMTLFFPQGDSSDVASIQYLKKVTFADRERKNPEEVVSESISFLERVQKYRIQSLEANGLINADEAAAARDEVTKRYTETGAVTGMFVDKSREMEKLKAMVDNHPEVFNTADAGIAFKQAWQVRDMALQSARSQTGSEKATLGGKAVAPIYAWYIDEIDKIAAAHPDFVLLANKFKEEWN